VKGGNKMPEGPEVRLCVDTIRPLVQNMVVKNAFSTSHGRYAENPPAGYKEFMRALI